MTAWDTGETSKTIVINHIGIYAATVTDNNGCKGSDTVRLTTLLILPSGFLPPDTSICSYGNVILKTAALYNQYNWSTGEISPVITVSQPGLYWLQVRDKNNCTGKDSILLNPKQCLAGYLSQAITSTCN